MSFAATKELKDRILKEKDRQNIRTSRWITNTLEEKLDELDQQNLIQE